MLILAYLLSNVVLLKQTNKLGRHKWNYLLLELFKTSILRYIINFLTSYVHHTTERFSFDQEIELSGLV